MPKFLLVFPLILFLFTGCVGRYYMFQARQLHAQTKKKSLSHFEAPLTPDLRERYQKACDLYFKAYYHEAPSFNLARIGHALEACMLAQDYLTARVFMGFQDRYKANHPSEVKHEKIAQPVWLKSETKMLYDAESIPLETPASSGTKPSVRQ